MDRLDAVTRRKLALTASKFGISRTSKSKRAQQHGRLLERIAAFIRGKWWFPAFVALLTLGATAIWLSTVPNRYTGSSTILVTPLSQSDNTLSGLGLPQQSNDAARPLQTLAQIAASAPINKMVVKRQKAKHVPPVKATTLAQSSLVRLTVVADSGALAAKYAESYAQATIDYRSSRLRSEIKRQVPLLRRSLKSAQGQIEQNLISQRLSSLATALASGDPTVRRGPSAVAATKPSSPKRTSSLVVAGLLGLGLGGLVLLLLSKLDPFIRRVEQIGELTELPLVAAVPTVKAQSENGGANDPFLPMQMPAHALEQFISVRNTIKAIRRSAGQSPSEPVVILVTGFGVHEGKSTTALALATCFANGHAKTLLIDGDLRSPKLTRVLGIERKHSFSDVLRGEIELEEQIIESGVLGPKIKFSVSRKPETPQLAADVLSLPTLGSAIEKAKSEAEVVIIDSAPLGVVSDALAYFAYADYVLLVGRLGHTRLKTVESVRKALGDRFDATNVGVVISDVPPVQAGEYSMYGYGDDY